MSDEKTAAEVFKETIGKLAEIAGGKDTTDEQRAAVAEMVENYGLTLDVIENDLKAIKPEISFTQLHAKDLANILRNAIEKTGKSEISEAVLESVSADVSHQFGQYITKEFKLNDTQVEELAEQLKTTAEKLKTPLRTWKGFATHDHLGKFSKGRTAIAAAALVGAGLIGRALFFGGRDEQPVPPTYQHNPHYAQAPQQGQWAEREAMRQAAMAEQGYAHGV